MKKNEPISLALFPAVMLMLFSAIVEINIYMARLYKLKRSPVFNLPVNLTTEVIVTSLTVIFAMLVLIIRRNYLRQNWVPKMIKKEIASPYDPGEPKKIEKKSIKNKFYA